MSDVSMRRATVNDLQAIISLLANDPLGAVREDPGVPLRVTYLQAFEAIDSDPNQFLAVATLDDTVVGTLQLTFIPNLSRMGAWRAQIEAVRVHECMRDQGLGRRLFEWAFEQSRLRGCVLVQLTCDRQRPGAHKFYESLGLTATHTGFKMEL